jgi:hypothetical protein
MTKSSCIAAVLSEFLTRSSREQGRVIEEGTYANLTHRDVGVLTRVIRAQQAIIRDCPLAPTQRESTNVSTFGLVWISNGYH